MRGAAKFTPRQEPAIHVQAPRSEHARRRLADLFGPAYGNVVLTCHSFPPSFHEARLYVGADDRIYSYGSHFELGRLVGGRCCGFFLLNGDRYSVSTSGHQSVVRSAVAATGIPSVIVPYSALHAASVDLDSIRPLDAKPERTDSWTEDIGPIWAPGDPDTFATDSNGNYDAEGVPQYRTREWRRNFGSSVHAVELLHGFDYSPGVGWRDYEPGEKVSYYDSQGNGVEIIDGRFHVRRYRHFLGACLFTARVRGRKGRRKFLSAFDENERRPLYFLAELPRCTARTYEEAIDALAPRIVHAAYAQGRDVKRQGDVFAIPTELDRRTFGRDDGASCVDTRRARGLAHGR